MKKRSASGIRVLVASAVIAAHSTSAVAYPVIIGCQQGRVKDDLIDAAKLQSLALDLSTSRAGGGLDGRFRRLCSGSEDCFRVLEQAILLTSQVAEITSVLVHQEITEALARQAREAAAAEAKRLVAKKRAELGLTRIDASLGKAARDTVDMAYEVHACRKAQEDMNEADFRLYNHHDPDPSYGDGGIVLQHRLDNEFMRVTGRMKNPTETERGKTRKVSIEGVRDIIETAVASGLDPYTALAVNFWEEGTERHFTLDPAPMIEMMGCPMTKQEIIADTDDAKREAIIAKYEASGTPYVYSYGTFYTFQPGVKSRSDLDSAMHSYMGVYESRLKAQQAQGKRSGERVVREERLFCLQGKGEFMAKTNGEYVLSYRSQEQFRKEPWYVPPGSWDTKQACCIRVPYENYKQVADLMASRYMAERLNPNRHSSPEHMIQSFNGFTDLMGAAESRGVGAFRLGINTKTNPQYGYQAMDYILNTFSNNPTIRAMVANAEEKMGKSPKNALCVGKSDGVYVVDSNHYVELSKATPRFASVIGKSWESLGSRQKRLVQLEWRKMEEDLDAWARKGSLSEAEREDYVRKVKAFGRLSGDAEKWAFYRTNLYPYRDTLGKTTMKSWQYYSDQQILELRRSIWWANNPHQH